MNKNRKELEDKLKIIALSFNEKTYATLPIETKGLLKKQFKGFMTDKNKPLAIFKSTKEDNLSLTSYGFFIVLFSGIYPKVYQERIPVSSLNTNILSAMSKILEEPYFITNDIVYHFDEYINLEKSIHGSFLDLIHHNSLSLKD